MNHWRPSRQWMFLFLLAGVFLLAMKPRQEPDNVTLIRFSAQTSPQQITLLWETASELGVFAFRIQRCLPNGDTARCGLDRDAHYTDISDNILSQGDDATGAQYQWADIAVEPGITYFYRLLVIDDLGTPGDPHGPVWGTPGANPTPTLLVTTTPTATLPTPTLDPHKGKIYLPFLVK